MRVVPRILKIIRPGMQRCVRDFFCAPRGRLPAGQKLIFLVRFVQKIAPEHE